LKKAEEKRGRKGTFVVAGMALFILVLFSFPRSAVSGALEKNSILSVILSDPLIHICAFGSFAIVLAWHFSGQRKIKFFLGRVALLAISYGLFIEIYQIFIPYRSFQVIDLVFDGVGISLALGATAIINGANGKRREVERQGNSD